MAKQFRVALHAHASAVVCVEAESYMEARRAAKEEVKAGRVKPLPIRADDWTSVSVTDMSGPCA